MSNWNVNTVFRSAEDYHLGDYRNVWLVWRFVCANTEYIRSVFWLETLKHWMFLFSDSNYIFFTSVALYVCICACLEIFFLSLKEYFLIFSIPLNFAYRLTVETKREVVYHRRTSEWVCSAISLLYVVTKSRFIPLSIYNSFSIK